MRHTLLSLLLASVLVAAVPAAANAAGATTTTVSRKVQVPGTYDVTLSIRGASARDLAVVRIGRSVTRRVRLKGRTPRRVRVRVVIGGKRVVARVAGRRGRPKVRASLRRVKRRPPAPTPAPTPVAAVPSTLVWSDEFDGSAGTLPSGSRWRAETGDGWGNGAEWQTYTSSANNASLDGAGNLAITARREPGVGAHGYTSARLTTQGKFSFRYGRLEARMSLPYGKGLWPAFWAMGDDINTAGWPANGEIDVMEALGHDPFTWYAHVHGPDANNNDAPWGRDILSSSNLTAGFHNYAVVWSPDVIRWTFDGNTVASVTPADLPAGGRWVYDHAFHVLLSLAVGGSWPGYPDASTPLPASWKVDYVRVYQ
jgi:beta-glucanase (GH16 family)